MESNYSLADIRSAVDGDGFGSGNGMWVILLFLVLFGGRGFGFGNGGEAGGTLNTDFAILERKLDGITNGICQSEYENARLNTQTMMAMQQGFAQQAQCCCETQRAIDNVNYLGQKNTCDIIAAIHSEGEATRNMFQQDKIEALQAQVNQLQTKGAIDRATCGIVRYPQTIAYSAGASPFFGNCGYGCNTCI